jgi:hypothetical protein
MVWGSGNRVSFPISRARAALIWIIAPAIRRMHAGAVREPAELVAEIGDERDVCRESLSRWSIGPALACGQAALVARIDSRKRLQSKAGPGSVLRPGAISLCPAIRASVIPG